MCLWTLEVSLLNYDSFYETENGLIFVVVADKRQVFETKPQSHSHIQSTEELMVSRNTSKDVHKALKNLHHCVFFHVCHQYFSFCNYFLFYSFFLFFMFIIFSVDSYILLSFSLHAIFHCK